MLGTSRKYVLITEMIIISHSHVEFHITVIIIILTSLLIIVVTGNRSSTTTSIFALGEGFVSSLGVEGICFSSLPLRSLYWFLGFQVGAPHL